MSEDFGKWLHEQMERNLPTDLITRLQPDRDYDGQPQTEAGERGKTMVQGLTFRDVVDCYVIACYESSGLPYEDYPTSIYNLPWDGMDPGAIGQNLMVAMEQRMGIYPNVPPLVYEEES